MPNYDYYCLGCDADFEEFATIKDRHMIKHQCGKLARLILRTPPNAAVFRAGFFPHLDKNPVYAGSKQQLKDECNKRDKFMPYAWD